MCTIPINTDQTIHRNTAEKTRPEDKASDETSSSQQTIFLLPKTPLTYHGQDQKNRSPNMVEWLSKYCQEPGSSSIIAFGKIRSKTVHIVCTKIYFVWDCSGNTKATVFLAGHLEIISMRHLWYFVDHEACFPRSNYVKYIMDMTCHRVWCSQL